GPRLSLGARADPTLGRLGYRFAFGARNGLVDTRCDPLDLPRIEVDAAIAARPGRLAWRIYRGARP
ncbi:polysaccharide deacetylase family protein, partial [Pseudomonas aeruginosa]|nr:polysaccharide deacetylase family protein [Pseudomonas aeruginosa]